MTKLFLINQLKRLVLRSTNYKPLSTKYGFTIVELLVVIVVIGILAAITIVAYTGIAQKATAASLETDLSGASKQLKLFQVANTNEYYPATINCAIPDSSTNKCIKASGTNSYTYAFNNSVSPRTFTLDAINGTTKYRITNDTSPVAVIPLVCQSGFIVVPGSATYGTSDFCVMKYEAKNVGGVATSQAASMPWTSISQDTAITVSSAACVGCHLITEAEWMTIAQNVLGVASNWDNGAGVHTVGTGYIYSGHNNGYSGDMIVADTNDANGYYLTGDTSPSNQRRTLTLSNGAVIWDLAGNAWEWTSGQATGGQPGVTGAGDDWREWTAITNPGTLPINASPVFTGISGANTWNSSNGMGKIRSNTENVILRGIYRGGTMGSSIYAGVLSVMFYDVPANTSYWIGFRIAK